MPYEHGPDAKRMPEWLRRPVARPGAYDAVTGLLGELRLNTVCRQARCPNQGECFSSGTATFLVLGDACTRGCRFCAVESRTPEAPDTGEPARVAEAALRLGLRHVVVTMVTRDDLSDGGAGHVAATVAALREAVPEASVEVLTSDFGGDDGALETVLASRPDVFNHNLETVPRLYAEVRPGADYGRSLGLLARAREIAPDVPAKSGLMLGLGETSDEVLEVMRDLRAAGVGLLTLGQYLRPGPANLPVAEFVRPEVFADLERAGLGMGFDAVASAPYVRSSYHAGEMRERAARG
ncbi:MAG: lipoyl synthase [Coriobacteriia bacterium]